MDMADDDIVESGQETGTTNQLIKSAFRKFNGHEGEARIRMDERDRLARELHDSTSQLLVLLELQLMRLKRLSSAPRSQAFERVLADLGACIAGLHQELRDLGNFWHDPETLGNDLSMMASAFAGQSGVTIRTEIASLPVDTSPSVAHVIYRVAQEALANISRHANARNVCLSLSTEPSSITLRISDDGVGFGRSESLPSDARGIVNMNERLNEVGGKLTIECLERGALLIAKIDR
jgi:signal transduction histidine kinase